MLFLSNLKLCRKEKKWTISFGDVLFLSNLKHVGDEKIENLALEMCYF